MSFSTEHPLRPCKPVLFPLVRFVDLEGLDLDYVAPALSFEQEAAKLPSGAPSPSSSPYNAGAPGGRYYNARMEELLSDYDEEAPLPGTLLRSFMGSTLLGFSSAALVQPFEVGKTLLQVQWIPKSLADAEVLSEPDLDQDDLPAPEDFSDEDQTEDYFTDLNARQPLSASRTNIPSSTRITHTRDVSGYLTRRSVFDQDSKVHPAKPCLSPARLTRDLQPEYTLPVVITGGVWEMMRSIGRWTGEGWLSLWKGQLTSFVTDSLGTLVQPFVLSILNSTFTSPTSLPSLPLVHSPRPTVPLFIHVASHLLTGFALSPLELIRTRLVVQSRQRAHRRYEGPVDALYKIIAEEGGWGGIYLNANLVIPAILDHLCRPLLHLAAPLAIERLFGISPAESPAVYAMAEFVLGSASLLITLPIETIRKRLQVQYRGHSRRLALRTCVETRPQPYAGVVEALYRIVTEETGTLPKSLTRKAKMQRKRSGSGQGPVDAQDIQTASWLGGFRQLYRGMGMAITAQAVVLLLTLAGGKESGSAGWAEV